MGPEKGGSARMPTGARWGGEGPCKLGGWASEEGRSVESRQGSGVVEQVWRLLRRVIFRMVSLPGITPSQAEAYHREPSFSL